MQIHFYKYQATGNYFVIIDNRYTGITLTTEQIQRICDRKFGVGADGLMMIEKHPQFDFNLIYYNSDGSQSLCGNGSRAAVMMASALGMLDRRTRFNAYDGPHDAELANGQVKLKMNDVSSMVRYGDEVFINTGSPHLIRFVENNKHYQVFDQGRTLRYDERFQPGGTNVNFVELIDENRIFVRTYERGVENETLSCGTGVVAAALASAQKGYRSPIAIKVLGGDLSVEFKSGPNGTFTDIFLIGPAKLVFEGDLEL